MQIQLRQTEIEAALKQYVAAQGINLVGKRVEITFTAGRKEQGMSADISIEAAGDLPDLSDDSAENTPAKPALTVVQGDAPKADAKPAEAPKVEAAPTADAKEAANETPAKAATTSLFG